MGLASSTSARQCSAAVIRSIRPLPFEAREDTRNKTAAEEAPLRGRIRSEWSVVDVEEQTNRRIEHRADEEAGVARLHARGLSGVGADVEQRVLRVEADRHVVLRPVLDAETPVGG